MMCDRYEGPVPVLTLATGEVGNVPTVQDGPMTAERLMDLRGVLAVMAEHPIATLEIRPMSERASRDKGILLSPVSPLAKHLSQLISETSRKSTAVAKAAGTGETLYRMVVPSKFAAQFGTGAVKSMSSKAVDGGVYSALTGPGGIKGAATFVPVAATSTATAAAGTAIAVAAPLVLMAVAVSVSANAEARQKRAIENITELLKEIGEEKLQDERRMLNACRTAVKDATAILLDKGTIGHSLGLDSAVHDIEKSLTNTEDRLREWKEAITKFPENRRMELKQLKAFPGIADQGGKFRTHLEIAALAVALKRRVIVLQAVEHAQLSEGNMFENFSHELRVNQERVDKLEWEINRVLGELARVEIKRQSGLRAPVFKTGEVDKLLNQAYRVRSIGERIELPGKAADVTIDIARHRDGSLVVLPAESA